MNETKTIESGADADAHKDNLTSALPLEHPDASVEGGPYGEPEWTDRRLRVDATVAAGQKFLAGAVADMSVLASRPYSSLMVAQRAEAIAMIAAGLQKLNDTRN